MAVQKRKCSDCLMMQASYQCEVCRKQGKLMPADEVHHIIPLAVDWSKRLDRANLVCLCHKHHMEAHKKLKAGHGGGQNCSQGVDD